MQWYGWYIVMWKRGLDFTGRTSRHGYWYVVLMNVLIGIAINIVGAVARSGAAGLASDPCSTPYPRSIRSRRWFRGWR